MKCLLCPNEFDDLKEFPTVYVEALRGEFYDEAGRRAHSAEQDRWQQIEVVLGACGEVSIMQGHICPSCANVETLRHLTIARSGEPLREFDPYAKRVLAFMTSRDMKPVANNVVVVRDPNVDARNPRPDSGTTGLELRERADAIAQASS
jgi:hypothetical protein